MANAPSIRGWTAAESPFHTEELVVQERVGVRAHMDVVARRAGIRDYMPEQHREFFGARPFLLIGAVDASGQPWPTILVNQPGFVSTPDSHTLRIAASVPVGSPLQGQLHVGSFLGTLGIQLTTGRRNRANGVIAAFDDDGLTLAVRQSYGNCNRYIQARTPDLIQDGNPQLPRILSNTDRLSMADQDLLRHADTFFIASAYFSQQQLLTQGADVSHRGGRPGFIRIDDDQSLTIPDFAGNLFFNTIGNLLHDPRVGLLFIDFASADLLYLAGEAHMIWDGPEVDAFAGAQRLIQFRLHQVRRVTHALPIRWSSVRYSDFLRGTGTWQEADLKLKLNELHGALP